MPFWNRFSHHDDDENEQYFFNWDEDEDDDEGAEDKEFQIFDMRDLTADEIKKSLDDETYEMLLHSLESRMFSTKWGNVFMVDAVNIEGYIVEERYNLDKDVVEISVGFHKDNKTEDIPIYVASPEKIDDINNIYNLVCASIASHSIKKLVNTYTKIITFINWEERDEC